MHFGRLGEEEEGVVVELVLESGECYQGGEGKWGRGFLIGMWDGIKS